MIKRPTYYLNRDGEFVIGNYNLAKAFSSFFPGIAGKWGIPAWVFYVNRGQAIASFGIKDKDHPVMEFQPANKAYYLTPVLGFRTFIKTARANKRFFYDAFSGSMGLPRFDTDSSMAISPDGLSLKEINRSLGLEAVIDYFSIPGDNYGALARKLTLRNTGRQKVSIELLDGMPQVQPYGLNNMFLKQMSRTVEAWIMVENFDNGIPFVRLKVEPADRPEVVHVKQGNFYLSFDKGGLVRPLIETEKVFGIQNDFVYPKPFAEAKKFTCPEKQRVRSKTPCAFAHKQVNLKAGSEYALYTITGNITSLDKLKSNSKRIADTAYFNMKQQESRDIVRSLCRGVFTSSSSERFDCYCAQNFLDNIMRGGSPISAGRASGRTNIYLYSRKHGDMERDYNMFLIEPTYFSQGNGNYRDINQNRRNDAWFNTALKDENVLSFFNLIQTDGYNPLVVKPDRFRFNRDYSCLRAFFDRHNIKKLKKFLSKSFTPGELFAFIEDSDIDFKSGKDELIRVIAENSQKQAQAAHGEGFWTDHWHYCLDMLESYLGLYPERLKEILLERKDFTFYDNTHIVKPRNKKYVFQNGRVWQYKSVMQDPDKAALIGRRKVFADISRRENGKGGIYRTSLVTKMLVVIANKFANLDPFGTGIEMEADKPNWYDSLNGLPGLFGSSTCETFELKRWILFLKESIKRLNLGAGYSVLLPRELQALLTGLEGACGKKLNDYRFWDNRHTIKENYRKKTVFGFHGRQVKVGLKRLESILDIFLKKIDAGLHRAYDSKTGLYYSYFINEPVRYKAGLKGKQDVHARISKFKQVPLPIFLEGMVHAFRVKTDHRLLVRYYKAIRKSSLFDKELKMYKVCASLESMHEEIGRARVFAPGWLENESVWLHMEYKYMLELLRTGLYEQFYEDFKNVLVPFLDPAVYGRSILENSSFIASSKFAKKEERGTGFVARLSGSTAEFIHIWLIMCAGKEPFYLDKQGRLCAELKPVLPAWLFTKKKTALQDRNTFMFRFLNKTEVIYRNPKRENTFGKDSAKVEQIRIIPVKGRPITLTTPYIPAPYSYQLRDGGIRRLEIKLGGLSPKAF